MLVLVGELLGYVVTVATPDLIAAELVGLALRYPTAEPEPRPRPWEDPVVQRATELDLGVRLPSQIELSFVTVGAATSSSSEVVGSLDARIREMLGIDREG